MKQILFAACLVISAFSTSVWASDFFADPEGACSALEYLGVPSGGWKPSRAFPGEWGCLSQLVPFGSDSSNGMKNNIALYVNGTSRSRADDIRIKINVNNPSEKSAAFSRLTAAAQKFFTIAKTPMPAELARALKAQRPGSWNTEWGRAELVLEPGRIESFKVVLTDEKHLLEQQRSRSASAGDFDRCKKVVARAANYSVSLLKGAGDPVQESGYKSFMLKGRGEDLFFCEVHSGNRYKVKAALNGKLPFKYVAEEKM